MSENNKSPLETMLSDEIVTPYAYDFSETLESVLMQIHSLVLAIHSETLTMHFEIQLMRTEMQELQNVR